MADQEHDQEVSRRYRELGRDEPPPELDAKIRAEARRAVVTHPAPLVVPTGRRRWYFPVAAAAIIVLAVAVTWHVDREQADPYAALQETAPAMEPKVQPQAQEDKLSSLGARKQEEPRNVAPLAKRAENPAPMTAEKPAAPPTLAPAESAAGTRSAPRDREAAYALREDRARQERPAAAAPAPAPQRGAQSDTAMAPQAQVQGRLIGESPQQWLERIAQLRQQGRHDEADKALAEFRKRYPDYKIPEAMLEKVEKK